jgi:hypothetical protein
LLDSSGNVIATTVTDVDGQYAFPGLPGGSYTVVVTDTENVLGEKVQTGDPDATLDRQSTTTADGSGDDLDQDFGFAAAGAGADPSLSGYIGDTVFHDTGDGAGGAPDGLFQPGEGMEGVEVSLHVVGDNGTLATTYTDENGHYGFAGLDPGSFYEIQVRQSTLPGAPNSDLEPSVDPDGTLDSKTVRDMSTVGPVDLSADLGYNVSAAAIARTITGTVWDDRNADGTLNAGAGSTVDEAGNGLAGVSIVLYHDFNRDGKLDVFERIAARTVTDANGDFSFAAPDDLAHYLVAVTDTEGVLGRYWKSNGPNAGAHNNSQTDPYPVTFSGSALTTNATADFGYYRAGAALGNRTWIDTNGNGIQEPGESGLAGVPLELEVTYPNGDQATLATLSDASGFYRFPNLLLDEDHNLGNGGAGQPQYLIRSATTVPGYAPSTAINAGGNGKLDSDDHTGTIPAAFAQGEVDVAASADPARESDSAAFDFGYTTLAAGSGVVIGIVYEDIDGDGVYLVGADNPLSGVDVVITDNNNVATTLTTNANGYFELVVAKGAVTVGVDETTITGMANPTLTTNASGEGSNSTVLTVPDQGMVTDNTGYVENAQSQNFQGFVYEDKDGDGLYDGGKTDRPQAGVTVVIVDANGGAHRVTTDATGLFRQNVAAGKATITVDERTIRGISNPTLTTNANNQGSNPSTGDVPAGGTGTDNTGYVSNATKQSVTGRVYEDVDGSGTFTAGDAPQAGATVTITDSNGGLYTTTTSVNAMWRILRARMSRASSMKTETQTGSTTAGPLMRPRLVSKS